MIYKAFHGLSLSALGMGCMRFPTKEDGTIDEEKTERMIDFALENGVNYFDTAWVYGSSETVVGKLLEKHPRDSFYLATKFPGFDVSNFSKISEIFEEQLRRCRVDYFDFYLFHNVSEHNVDWYLDPKFGIYEYLLEQKKAGRIRHIGFSSHGTIDTMRRFMDAYDQLDFCQIQLNWIDWEFQNAKKKVELLNERNIPIWVMEPLRGGKLAALDSEYEQQLRALRTDEDIPAWSFRYIQSLPGIGVTLSGMSSFEQTEANIRTFESEKPLNENELRVLDGIAAEMTSRNGIPCTGCRYCVEGCPQGLDIPYLISLFNSHDGETVNGLPEDKRPAACIDCKACEAVCPQNIKIPQVFRNFRGRL